MTHPILEYERKRIAAELRERQHYRSVDAAEVAAATGKSVDEVMAAWNPGKWRVDADSRRLMWPKDAAAVLLNATLEQPLHPIVALYYIHLRRPPDAEGLAYWISEMNSGVPLPELEELWLTAAAEEVAAREDT
ncbi:MAG: hypothetical protein AAF565_16950 [Pseudomonadota bacterium]